MKIIRTCGDRDASQSREALALRTCCSLRDEHLGLRAPELDFEGYWLFAILEEGSPFRAIKMGFSVGRYEGEDLGAGVPGDPGNVLCVIELVNAKDSVSFSSDTLRRHEISQSGEETDILFGSLGRFRGSWPDLKFQMVEPESDIRLEFDLRGRNVHWWPDIILPGTYYRQYVCPDMELSGRVVLGGQSHPVKGMGAFDRPFGRLVKSPASRGVGYWHYDVIVWEDRLTTLSWFVTDLSGETWLNYGMGNFDRSRLLLFEKFEIEYLEFESRGEGIELPRRWKGTLSGEDGCLEYEVEALGQEYDPDKPHRSFLMPSLLLNCKGVLTTPGGDRRSLKGMGLPEYHVAHRGPLDTAPDCQDR